MNMKTGIILFIAAFTILGAEQLTPAQEFLSLNQTFVLHPAPRDHDSYSLYYNILVRSPGLIRVRLDLEHVSPDLAGEVKFLTVSLRQMENEVEVRRIEFGTSGIVLEYGVDAYELDRTDGEYRIVVSNWSQLHTAVARLVAWYPGEDDSERPWPDIPKHPRAEDLMF